LHAPLCHPQVGARTNAPAVAPYVRTDNRAARLVKLIAPCGSRDMDDPQTGIKAVEAGISDRIWSLQKIARLSDYRTLRTNANISISASASKARNYSCFPQCVGLRGSANLKSIAKSQSRQPATINGNATKARQLSISQALPIERSSSEN